MLPGAPAVEFYGCNDPAFPDCRQPAGSRCVNKKGDRVSPHPKRWNLGQGYADAWNERQIEVDTYIGQANLLRVKIDELEASVTNLLRQTAVLSSQLGSEQGLNDTLEATVADLKAQIAELTKPPEPEPTPEPLAVTKFGACPQKGGESLAAAQTVIDKYGPGSAVRQFLGTGVAQRPANASVVHVSWKPSLAQITEAWVKSVTASLRPGDCVEVWHEGNKKVSDGTLTLADITQRKNTFFDIVKKVRPDLLVIVTLTGWSLDPKSKTEIGPHLVKGDVLGVDCDGIKPTKLPYTDYEDETKKALEVIADPSNGYQWFAVPEFGCPRVAEDSDGSRRVAYHDHYANEWRASRKCLFVTLYEYSAAVPYALTLQLEVSGWRSQVAI